MKTNNKRLIVVLGMHRSGTSAITRGLQVLGVDLGINLQPAMLNVNEKGFFEDNDIVSLNVEMIASIHSDWHHLAPIEMSQVENLHNQGYHLRAVELLRQKAFSTAVFGFKDPRVARLLPFWKEVFASCQFNVDYVLALRHPLSVVKSLTKRDGMAAEQGYLLWLGHVMESLIGSADSNRMLVDYDRLIQSPDAELLRISKVLGLEINPVDLQSYKTQFLDQELRHTVYELSDLLMDNACPPIVHEVYAALIDVASDKTTLDDKELQNKVACWADEFERLKSPLLLADRLYAQKMAAMHALTEREEQIINLNQALTERDEQTINLNQALTERDEQTINLNHALTERDQQIINLNHTIEAVYLSTSWFITKPLRELSRWGQRLMRLIRLYKNYRRIYPGLSGIWRLVKRSIDAIRKGGITNLRTSIGMHSRSCTKVAKITLSSVLQLRDINDKADNLHNDVAVHAHIFYPDLATEIRNYLANIPVKFHCYVTTDTQDKAKLIETVFSDLRSIRTLEIYVVENKGRDLAPMIVGLGKMLVKHEVVLHIHSKRSPHNPALRGWRRYLMMSLLGSKQGVAAILQQFSQNKQLGILYPQTYNPVIPFMKIGGNEPFMADLLNRAGKKTAEIERIDLMNFPAGGMFWFRGKAIEPLVNMGLSLPDFDAEAGQDDGTLAHAIERLFLYFASDSGLYHQSYVPKQLSSSQPGTMPLSRLQDFCNQGLINKPVIMFDHNIGGGANHYGRELMKSILTDGNSVLRIYWANERWFVEWVGVDDGMILVALNEDDMFGTLAMTASRKIIVNSLYGYPNVDDISHRIVDLTHQLDATLDFKVHDFYAICPSQHLLDFNEKYCAVPQNHSTCNSCLKKNSAAYWASSQPVDIERWRSSFARLFEAADVISVFNISSIEILQKGFQLEPHKAIITHHSDDYFKCNKFVLTSGQLHVGVLGTLTTAKGAMVVNSLAEHIDSLGMKMPVTVVGRSVVPVMSRIKVLGNYDNYNLPEIVIHEGINVILMPSIVPETFSYTISEAMKMGLPIVTFDLGAQGNRVKQYELGEVVPLGSSPEVILAALNSALKKSQELRK